MLVIFHALTFRRRDNWVLCKQACSRMRARIDLVVKCDEDSVIMCAI